MLEALSDLWDGSEATFPAAGHPAEQLRYLLQYAWHPRPTTPNHGYSRLELMPWNSLLTDPAPCQSSTLRVGP